MSRTTKVVCDSCENDLTWTSNCEDWRLVLANDSIPSKGGFVTAMGARPAIDTTVHFCGIDCLRTWLDKRYPAGKGPYHGGKIGAAYQRQKRAGATETHLTPAHDD